MASLNGQTIAASYEQLLHVDADGGGNGTTHVSVKDGDNGTTFGFTIATDALMMTSTNRLEFGDNASYIHQSADGVLDLVSDTEIEINATTVDINGAVDISGSVGIGTASPTATSQLHVEAAKAEIRIKGTNDAASDEIAHLILEASTDRRAGITIEGDSNDIQAFMGRPYDSANTLVFETDATERMRINANGSIKSTHVSGVSGSTAFGDGAGIALASGGNYNTFFGVESGTATTTADGNTLVGYQTGDAITSGGDNNTGIGYQALSALTSGDRNIAIGYEAGLNMTAGSECVFIGAGAGKGSNHTDGDGTVCVGYQAGIDLVEARRSTAIGYQTLHDAVNNDNNTAVGYTVLASLDTGLNNTAIGVTSLVSLRSGDENVAIGYNAMGGAISSTNNVAIGSQAAQNFGGSDALNGEDNNVAIGQLAMGSVDGGSNQNALVRGNIAIGKEALTGGDFGSSDLNLDYNIAIGIDALNSTGGNQQTGTIAIGASAGTAINSNDASGTTIVGHQAGMNITNAPRNTFIGHEAGKDAVGGGDNTCVGYNAGENISDGSDNTLIGKGAGDNITSGLYNTCLGKDAQPSAADTDYAIVIGRAVSGGGNAVTIGNNSNTATLNIDGSDTSWAASSSDERYKENIETSTAGLSFINDLRPVTYNWKKAKDVPTNMTLYKKDSDEPVLGHEYGETLHGFIAQEVKSTIDKHSDIAESFKMWQEKEDGTQTVAPSSVIPMLVKAIQELSAKVTELENK